MARKKGTEDVNFSFVEEPKPRIKKDGTAEPNLECHNGLCPARNRCKTFKGDRSDYIMRFKRDPALCRMYTPKETVYTTKKRRF